MENKLKKPELLAPAGTIVSALTAFDSGADAVYAGLKKFNARERSENFTVEEMSATIAYAHSIGKRVYVTLNTILKESEVAEFAETVSQVATLGPDAVIVQDLGAIRIIRDYFPSLEIHASTQMAIHNSAGVKVAASLGIGRVILERQISLQELEAIIANSPIDVEVFIHGALCCSLSGICLLSSWMSGASGNRGYCRQPCRYDFAAPDGKRGFFLSTADLCAAENIPRLVRSGVSAFKIEGRLKKQDYVKNTVSAYRLLIDTSEKDFPAALKEAKSLLSLTCGRKWINGFSDRDSFSKMIISGSSGTMGALCGKVESTRNDGFYVSASAKIHLGDRLRVQSEKLEKGVILTVKKILAGGHFVTEAPPGRSCFIPSERRVRKGDNVFKIGESISDLSKKISSLPRCAGTSLDLDISVSARGFAIKVAISGVEFGHFVTAELKKAEKHPLTPEKISAEFASGVPVKFRTGKISAKIEAELFIPLSELKNSRRSFWDWANENINYDPAAEKAKDGLMKFIGDYSGEVKDANICEGITYAVTKSVSPPPGASHVGQSIFDYDSSADELILPFFCGENDIPRLEKLVAAAHGRGVRRFRATSLYCLEILRRYDGITMVSSYPFAATNSIATREFRRLGISQLQIWPELDKDEIINLLSRATLPMELFSSGTIPLLVTRGELGKVAEFSDENGNMFVVRHDPNMKVNMIFSKKSILIPSMPGTCEFRETRFPYPGEKDSCDFNFTKKLK